MSKTHIFVFLLLLMGVAWLVATSTHPSPHAFEGRCGECHLGTVRSSLFVGNIDRLCIRCHPENTKRSHPSNLLVARDLPEQFPKYQGKLTCVTCHFAHRLMGDSDESKARAEGNPYLLRYSRMGRAFCFQCHKQSSFDPQCTSHCTTIGVAHQNSADPQILKLLDRSSRDCLACHDGTISSNTDIGGASWEHAGGIGLSHPVGIPYSNSSRRGKQKYHPENSLPAELKLVNGRIECITCHDHYSKHKGLLVMDNRGSRMCLACHAM